MTSVATGKKAEAIVAVWLSERGFIIVERNWRTRWCEIDIVATLNETIYFVEVKYRSNLSYGDGLDYITRQKLRQIQFAAEFWIATHAWSGQYELAAISVIGSNFVVGELILL